MVFEQLVQDVAKELGNIGNPGLHAGPEVTDPVQGFFPVFIKVISLLGIRKFTLKDAVLVFLGPFGFLQGKLVIPFCKVGFLN